MFHAIWLGLKRLIEAISGKWSIETWMETIYKSSDEIICDTVRQKKWDYQSGTCTVTYESSSDITAQIRLLFQNADGQTEQMEAQRKFPLKQFCSEALDRLSSEKEIIFPIEHPAAK